jgi:hypothetical protein
MGFYYRNYCKQKQKRKDCVMTARSGWSGYSQTHQFVKTFFIERRARLADYGEFHFSESTAG